MSSIKVNPVLDENVKTAVTNAVGSEVRIVDYKIRPYSKEKGGAVALHYALKVNYKLPENPQVQVYNFFLKAAHCLDPENPETSVFEQFPVFFIEVDFFNKIIPSMLRHLKKDTFAPKCWLAVEDMLFLEDLGLAGFSKSKQEFQDLENMKCVISTLARFHAASLLAEAELKKPLVQVCPHIFNEKMFLENVKSIPGFLSTCLNMITELTKRFGLDCPDLDEISARLVEASKPLLNGVNVIGHGDLHKNNFMFNDSNPRKCILVDYQLLRYSTPAIDLTMLLYLNCTSKLRRTHERELIEEYYSAFRKTLEKSEVNVKIPEFENIWGAYEDGKFFGPVFMAMFLPGFLIEDHFLNLMSDQDNFKKYIFETRMNFLTPHLDNNPKFENEMKDMIQDFIAAFK